MKKAILLFALIITMSAFNEKETLVLPTCENWQYSNPGQSTAQTRDCVYGYGTIICTETRECPYCPTTQVCHYLWF